MVRQGKDRIYDSFYYAAFINDPNGFNVEVVCRKNLTKKQL